MSQTAAPIEGYGAFDNSLAGDVRDPYPEFVEKRRSHPVEIRSYGEGFPDSYVVYRYEDVARVMRDNETFSSAILQGVMGELMGPKIILAMDEPVHRRHRSLVSVAFRQSTLARWEETLVGVVVDGLIDQFAARGRAELVSEYTFPFPVQVIAGVLGLPREDFRQFQRWTVAIISGASQWERGLAASRELGEYLRSILEKRRAEPGDDLISDLAHAELDGQRLDEDEIFSFLRLLLPAGAETTFRSSGNLLYLLLTHPEALDAVRADRSLIPQAIEEALRLEPPLLLTSRVTTREVELSGVRIPPGSSVTPMLGSANRDPEHYEDPDTFNILRDAKQHVSFGGGPHMCLGMHLARMETRVALNALLDRLANLRLDGETAEREDAHIHGQIFRSPTSLPVLWDPGA